MVRMHLLTVTPVPSCMQTHWWELTRWLQIPETVLTVLESGRAKVTTPQRGRLLTVLYVAPGREGKGCSSLISLPKGFILQDLPLSHVIQRYMFLQGVGDIHTFRSRPFSPRLPLFICGLAALRTAPATQQELLSWCWMILRHVLPGLHYLQTFKAHYVIF